jgi:hypothetical protein
MNILPLLLLAVVELPASHFLGIPLQRDAFDVLSSPLEANPRLVRSGDGGNAETWACFRGADGATAVFASDAIGAGRINFYAFATNAQALILPEAIDTPTAMAACVPTARLTEQELGPADIRLGERFQAVVRRLGKPTESSGGLARWESDVDVSPTFARFRRIEVRLRNGRVISVAAYESTRS